MRTNGTIAGVICLLISAGSLCAALLTQTVFETLLWAFFGGFAGAGLSAILREKFKKR